jgi:hypothetical protein
MYNKKLPRKIVDTTVGNPCILVDGDFFIWTSTNMMICRYKVNTKGDREWRMKKTKDEYCRRHKIEGKYCRRRI